MTNVTFENCKLGNTNFKDAKLHHVRINRSDLSNANFENALVALSTLENTNFTNASLENSKFIYNLLDHTKMDGANLKDAVITFIDGRDTLTVAGQSLSKDDIKSMGVYIPDNYAHFRKQLLSDPNFKLTQEALNTMQRLEGLDLRGQDLSNLNLRQDQVNGVIFGSKEIKELKVDGKTVTKEQLKKWGAIILEPVWVSDGPGLMENSGLSAVFPGLVGNNSGLRAEFCYVTRDGNIRVRREVNEV